MPSAALAAILTFALIAPVEALIRGTAGAEQFAALFGSITMGFTGYVVVLLQVVLIAAVASEASRHTVNRVHRLDLTPGPPMPGDLPPPLCPISRYDPDRNWRLCRQTDADSQITISRIVDRAARAKAFRAGACAGLRPAAPSAC